MGHIHWTWDPRVLTWGVYLKRNLGFCCFFLFFSITRNQNYLIRPTQTVTTIYHIKRSNPNSKNIQKKLPKRTWFQNCQSRSQAQIFPSKITTFPRHKYKTWANQNRIKKKKPIKREEKIFKRNSKNKQIEISTAVKRETWKTARATNCSSLRVSWCHSFFWYRSSSELYQSASSGCALRCDSRYFRAAIDRMRRENLQNKWKKDERSRSWNSEGKNNPQTLDEFGKMKRRKTKPCSYVFILLEFAAAFGIPEF